MMEVNTLSRMAEGCQTMKVATRRRLIFELFSHRIIAVFGEFSQRDKEK
jgi:hypothetical protein